MMKDERRREKDVVGKNTKFKYFIIISQVSSSSVACEMKNSPGGILLREMKQRESLSPV